MFIPFECNIGGCRGRELGMKEVLIALGLTEVWKLNREVSDREVLVVVVLVMMYLNDAVNEWKTLTA